jgi:hypothetical protein
MNPALLWDDLRAEAKRLRAEVQAAKERLRQHLEFLDPDGSHSKALATFVRPNLGSTPEPVARLLEPLVAGAAALALAVLVGVGMWGFAVMFLAASLAYAILVHVFGIEFDFHLPV